MGLGQTAGLSDVSEISNGSLICDRSLRVSTITKALSDTGAGALISRGTRTGEGSRAMASCAALILLASELTHCRPAVSATVLRWFTCSTNGAAGAAATATAGAGAGAGTGAGAGAGAGVNVGANATTGTATGSMTTAGTASSASAAKSGTPLIAVGVAMLVATAAGANDEIGVGSAAFTS